MPTNSGAPGGPKLPSFTDEASVFRADATRADVQAALSQLALDPTSLAALRYAALRKLEEQAPSAVVPVAEQLAMSSSTSKDAAFLRMNATAVLTRSQLPEGKAALARVQKSSLEAGLLAARLTEAGGH